MVGNMYVLQLEQTLNLVGPENVNVDQVYLLVDRNTFPPFMWIVKT